MSLNSGYFRVFRVVENLQSRPPDRSHRRGFSLVEVLAALTVLGVAATGVVTVGNAGRRLAEIAAVRNAQVLAVRSVIARTSMEAMGSSDTVLVGTRMMAVAVDTTRVSPQVLEMTITVEGAGPAGAYEVVTRRAGMGW